MDFRAKCEVWRDVGTWSICSISFIPMKPADEDIPTELLPPSLQDKQDVAVKLKSNKVRIGPIYYKGSYKAT
jgi:hypothetical protein